MSRATKKSSVQLIFLPSSSMSPFGSTSQNSFLPSYGYQLKHSSGFSAQWKPVCAQNAFSVVFNPGWYLYSPLPCVATSPGSNPLQASITKITPTKSAAWNRPRTPSSCAAESSASAFLPPLRFPLPRRTASRPWRARALRRASAPASASRVPP